MNDSELAEAVCEIRKGEPPLYDEWQLDSELVTDWRVAGALMEKAHAAEFTIWRQNYDDDEPVWVVETSHVKADGRDESLPRAIIEACARFLSHTGNDTCTDQTER